MTESYDQGREVAVEGFQTARQGRDKQSGQYYAKRGSSREPAAYSALHAAVEEFAAREALLVRFERG